MVVVERPTLTDTSEVFGREFQPTSKERARGELNSPASVRPLFGRHGQNGEAPGLVPEVLHYLPSLVGLRYFVSLIFPSQPITADVNINIKFDSVCVSHIRRFNLLVPTPVNSISMKKVCTGMREHKRKVGERGQVTIPKELRDRQGIKGGDEIEFVETNDEIVIKPPTDKERLAEGYRERAERSQQLTEEMAPASSEATDRLGEAPSWSE